MPLTCTRHLSFCAGHRVLGHENKCGNLHGHNYHVELTAAVEANQHAEVDELGRVIDFSVLKARIDPFLQEQWDHGFLLHVDDDSAREVLDRFAACGREATASEGRAPVPIASRRIIAPDGCGLRERLLPQQKLYLLPYNPTAENLALYLRTVVCPQALKGTGVAVTRVIVHETANCFATSEE